MKKNEVLSKIIKLIREEMMTGNAVGTQGGFSNNPPKAGVDGYDTFLNNRKRKKRIGVWSRSLRKNSAR